MTRGLLALLLLAAPLAPAARAEEPVAAAAEGADALWAQRIDRSKLEGALAAWEAQVAANPGDRQALLMLTRGWYLLGDSHLTDTDAKIAAWDKATGWGRKCLAQNPAWAAKVATDKEKDAVDVLTKDDAPCAYWLATALGKWGKAQSTMKILALLPTVKAFISRVDQLDPEYFHYGPTRYWGAFYSASSLTLDPEKSAQAFTASIDGAPYYLPTRGLRAEQLAVRTRNFDLFAEDIQFILKFDVKSYPELEPENTLEQRKTAALWAQRRDLFDAATVDAWEQAHPDAIR
jgi:hypothetical protein